MALSWNEIKNRAINFSKEWEKEQREHAESQSFWNDFFNIFGISRKRVASFEEPVKKLGEQRGRIDLFWKGTLLVEHKSRGKDLSKAYTQAMDYFPGLKEAELPKYILISDFETFKSRAISTFISSIFPCSSISSFTNFRNSNKAVITIGFFIF